MRKEQVIEQHIISSLQSSYGIEVATITPFALGADADALIYKVESSDQMFYFVKLKRGQHDISASLQLLLHDSKIKEIICPIKTLDKQPQAYIQDFTLTVYPFIDGRDGFSQNLTDDQWITFGKALRQVHQLELPASIKKTIKRENFSPQWRNKVKSIYENIEDVIPPDEIALKFLASLKNHKPEILYLADKAEELAGVIQKQSNDFVLCHSDIHAGNVLIANDGSLYIVDWDQPIMAPRERDLMFIGAGVGNVWNNKYETKQFYTGYGYTVINQNLIDYYRCDRILQDVAEYYEQLLSDSVGYKDRLTGYNHFLVMFEPNGVVGIVSNLIRVDRTILYNSEMLCIFMKESNFKISRIPFYFARHGNTDWNKENKVMGQIDIPLNEVGLEQANVIAEKLADLGISHIFSGPLKRTIQTSEIIAQTTHAPITIIEEFKNAYAGIMEGQDRGDGKWLEDWRMGGNVRDAESWAEFVLRVEIGLKKALTQVKDDKPILIVGHGPTYWALVQTLNAQATNAKVENCNVYFFRPPEANSNQWHVNVLAK